VRTPKIIVILCVGFSVAPDRSCVEARRGDSGIFVSAKVVVG